MGRRDEERNYRGSRTDHKKEDEEAGDKELLILRRVLSQHKGVKDRPSNHSPTPPISQTLKQNCQFIPEPLLEAPNSELRACEEVVQSWYKESPMYNTQISKGSERTRVSKFNRELCEWLILFLPKLKQGEEVIT